MANLGISTKRIQINKANTTMVIVVAVSAFVVTFSAVACRALLVRRAFQARVISKKETAVKQLKDNLAAADQLKLSYKAFVETPDNVIGGNPKGTGDRDGDNAKIVLDALPSKYDFPALATSMEKILKTSNYKIESISGTDDEIAQSSAESNDSKPIEMPFEISASSDYSGIQNLLDLFGRSIRPINVQTLELSGTNADLTATITAITYYQPEKTLNFKTEEVR